MKLTMILAVSPILKGNKCQCLFHFVYLNYLISATFKEALLLNKCHIFWLDLETSTALKQAPPSNKHRNKTQAKAITVSIVLVIFNMKCKAYKTNKYVIKCLFYYFISFRKCLHSLHCVAVLFFNKQCHGKAVGPITKP